MSHKGMTWQRLIKLEPKLLELYNRAQAIRKRKRTFDPLKVWIGSRHGMKDEMAALVGWNRADVPELGTNAAYDIAYDRIYYEALLGEPLEEGLESD